VASSGGSLVAKYKTHNLRALAKSTGIDFTDNDAETLQWLSGHVEYMGRVAACEPPVPVRRYEWPHAGSAAN
jgi:hypothetical protein